MTRSWKSSSATDTTRLLMQHQESVSSKTIGIVLLLFCTVAFIQIGGQAKIISVSFFAFAACWLYIGFNSVNPLHAAIAFFLMCPSVLFYINDTRFLDFLLRVLREFSVLIIFLAAMNFDRPLKSRNFWLKAAFTFQIVCLIFAILQLVSILFSVPAFFLPYELYGNITGDELSSSESRITTVPSYWIEFGGDRSLVLGEEFKIRPVAFYAEPSYLAFILLSISFFIEITSNDDVKSTRLGYLFSFLGIAIAQSASGLVFLAIMFGSYEIGRINRSNRAFYGGLIGFAIIVIVIFLAGERLFSVMDIEQEASGFIRMVMPIIRISEVFNLDNYFGLPSGLFLDIFSPFVNGIYIGLGVDNSVFNLIINYGVLGILLILLSIQIFDPRVWLFLFCVSQFNGALLSYDKGAVVGFILAQYFAIRRLRT